MKTITIEARGRESALGFVTALEEFRPRLVETEAGDFHVAIDLTGTHIDVVALLTAIQQHVIDRDDGSAVVNLDQQMHTLHAP